MRHELRMRIKYIIVTRKRTVHWNAGPRRYLQQEQGSGTAGVCTLKTGRAKRKRV